LHFLEYDPANNAFDLRLKPASGAVGRGSTILAPATDVEGTLRSPPIDIGAYQRRPSVKTRP
jgi:hypothetical protein